ncbi:hypothetical protein EO98_08520 [Methanosarcina sp. 2.H.T.1A.6]|nr:hypothetical protein EO94_10375 [Methanosarcina sp. 2.H.T.1A.3]KKG15474.1 hypothetical protein EO97_11835 [Methanosarcina sp. 2.H.T.1A.15]KKG20131.1 hypothetical protein EO98_08520 [Methanosarcina sp. 2.H.T.1A.6]KKG23549.1 hypothetical protein EO96_08580 [Methanosarcina sp. 2.H.T.1A.8]
MMEAIFYLKPGMVLPSPITIIFFIFTSKLSFLSLPLKNQLKGKGDIRANKMPVCVFRAYNTSSDLSVDIYIRNYNRILKV